MSPAEMDGPTDEGAAAGSDDLALALGGGGVRAAYQVGALRSLARRHPNLRVPVLTGVSAGAINAVQLAAFRGTFAEAVEELRELWLSIETAKIFRTDPASLAAIVLRWGSSFLSGRSRAALQPRGLVDTAPLREFLTAALHTRDGALEGIARNIEEGKLRSLAITTTHYGTGRPITWVQGREVEVWNRPQREAVLATIRLEHVLASAAIPLVFPAVRLDGSWHGDGGIGQIAPLSPALHLGGSRIVTVSTRRRPPAGASGDATPELYPPPAQILSVLLDAVFLDMLDFDVLNLNRISALVEGLPEHSRQGLRSARAFVLRPSRDLGKIAAEHQPRLPRLLRFLLRSLGADERRSVDFLSMVLFEPAFIRRLLDLGEADADQKAGELEAFLGVDKNSHF